MKNFSFISVVELIRADGSIIINKKLNFSLGTHTTMVYTELLSRFMYFSEKNKLTDDGYFFNTVDDLKLGTGLGKTAQLNAINKLVKLGFIKKDLRGVPPKRYFKIVPNTELIDKYLKKGANEMEKLKEKQADNADIAQISYNKRFKSNATSESNRMPQASNNIQFNNTNSNNTKEKGFGQNPNDFETPMIFIFATDYAANDYEIDNVQYYLQKYKSVMRKEHEPLKPSQWKRVFNKITSAGDNEVLGNEFKRIVDQHFKTDYKDCDYNINHFVSGQIMLNRYYEIERDKDQERAG